MGRGRFVNIFPLPQMAVKSVPAKLRCVLSRCAWPLASSSRKSVSTLRRSRSSHFRNGKELRQFAPLYGGKPIELAGFFLGNGGRGGPGANEERQYIALDLSQEDSWGTVFHEYAHLLINSNFPPSPVWFDEGFAEYCSSLKVDKKEIAIGLVKPELPELLSQSRWLKTG